MEERRESTLRAIGASWMSLKTWVKVWLIVLNIVFIVGVVFIGDEPVVDWALITYVTTLPFLLAFMVPQRGLSRILGLAHIVPWTPLLVYLLLRLLGDSVLGPHVSFAGQPLLFAYLVLLTSTIAFCLAFDYYDVARWIRGERYIMGSVEAYRRGASQLAGGLREVYEDVPGDGDSTSVDVGTGDR